MGKYHLFVIPVFLYLVAGLLATVPAMAFEIIDDEGQHLQFDKPFARIISLYPAHTENLASLSCENSLIGIGVNDDYPHRLAALPRFSYHDNTEKFLAAAPDLLLIRPMISRSQPELIGKLRDSGITVVSLQPTSPDTLFTYWRQLAELCGQPQQGARMAQTFTDALNDLTAFLPEERVRPRVYFEAIHAKMKTFAPTAISIFALTAAGGRNAAADAIGRNGSNIAPYGKERILSHAGEIDFFLSQVGRMNRVELDDIYHEPGFQLIKAVQNQNVCLIEEDIVSRPTMRLLQGIKELHACLYPDNKPAVSAYSRNGDHSSSQFHGH